MNGAPGMPASSSHPSESILVAYSRGGLDAPAVVAVEHHLTGCPRCRASVGATVDPTRLAATWFGVEAELAVPRRSLLERLLLAIRVPATAVRLVLATPALRRSWFVAILLALLFGVGAAAGDRPESSTWTFLTLAPLVPVMGVALAYGPGSDPAHELTVATPMSGFHLVLVRAVTVLAVSVAGTGLAALLVPASAALTVGWWLLPALALSVICLALSTAISPRVAGWWVAGGWVVLMVGSADRFTELGHYGPGVAALLVAGGLVGSAVVVGRRAAFEAVRS